MSRGVSWQGDSGGAFVDMLRLTLGGMFQVQYNAAGSKGTFSGPVDCAKQIVRSQGLVGLFRGWLPTCLCRMSNYSYFGGYAYFRKVFNPEGGKMGLVSSVGAGGAAGVCYWLSCYPMDGKGQPTPIPRTQLIPPAACRRYPHCLNILCTLVDHVLLLVVTVVKNRMMSAPASGPLVYVPSLLTMLCAN